MTDRQLHPRYPLNGTVNPIKENNMTTQLYEVTMKMTIRASNRKGAHLISQKIVDKVISLITIRDEIKFFDVDPVITGMKALGKVDDEPHERMHRVVECIKSGDREQTLKEV